MKSSLHIVHWITYSNNKAKHNYLKNLNKLTTTTALRCTPYVLIAGGTVHESFDVGAGKYGAVARANIVVDSKKISAVSCIRCNEGVEWKALPHFQILDLDAGFPTLSVVHNVSSWSIGKLLVLTLIYLGPDVRN